MINDETINVLAIDTGKNCGIVHYKGSPSIKLIKDDSRVTFYKLSLEVKKDRDIHRGGRYQLFHNQLELLKDNIKDDLHAIIFEEITDHRSVHASNSYGGYYGMLAKFCTTNSIPLIGIGCTNVKLSFTGDGAATKSDMITRARQFFPNYPFTHDEADALGILFTFLNSKRFMSQSHLSDHSILS